jgi:hypothetical protein
MCGDLEARIKKLEDSKTGCFYELFDFIRWVLIFYWLFLFMNAYRATEDFTKLRPPKDPPAEVRH